VCPLAGSTNPVDCERSSPSALCGREDEEIVVNIEIDLNRLVLAVIPPLCSLLDIARNGCPYCAGKAASGGNNTNV